MTLPLVQLTGSAYDQGRQHGEQLRPRIAHNVDVYFYRFGEEAGLARPEVLRRAALYRPQIARQNPAYYRGMEGIATGSGFPLEVIIALNVRYEILYYATVQTALAQAGVDGCTGFAIAPAASASGHLLLGQNWDWIPEVQGALLHTTEPAGLTTLSFTEAGIFGGKIGLNSAGLGLVINGMTTLDDDWQRLHKPFHVRTYEILRQTTLEAAVAVVAGEERALSGNFMIAQTPDRVVNIEAAPAVLATHSWENGQLIHTNHFLDPGAMGVTEPDKVYRGTSCRRYDRMQELVTATRPVRVADLQTFLQDHVTAPKTICRHEDPAAPVDEQTRTVTSVIMDLHARTLQASDGPPCQHPYTTYRLDSPA